MTPARARTLLGLGKDFDAPAVRSAYADKLRAMDPDADPAGFAALRDARDTLLAAARNRAAAPLADPFADAEEPAQASDWPYAAPRIAATAQGIAAQLSFAPDAPFYAGKGAAAGAAAEAPLRIDPSPFAIPRLVDRAPEPGEVLSDRGRWAALESLLTEGDLGIALTDAETARAMGHLAVVIRLIDGLPIDQSTGAEDALAHMLARAWPRSAPLLETAAAAFGWSVELGQLKERPAVAFLNARLNGLRFVAEVENPGHPWHGAWVELSSPGFRRNRLANHANIVKLLTRIRNDFPEVERYLDAQRVGAWEAKLFAPKKNWLDGWVRRGSKGYVWAVIVIAGLRLLVSIAGGLDGNSAPFDRSVQAPDVLVLDDAAHHWFGPETDLAGLRRMAPLVAAIAKRNAGGTTDEATADRAMRSAVFLALALSTEQVDAERLRAVQSVRARALDATTLAGMHACMDFIKLGQVDDVVAMPDSITGEAVTQVRAIATTGFYNRDPEIKPMQAAIPGSVVREVMGVTHLSQNRVHSALQQRGSDAELCLVHSALLDAALKLPGRAGEAILRTL